MGLEQLVLRSASRLVLMLSGYAFLLLTLLLGIAPIVCAQSPSTSSGIDLRETETVVKKAAGPKADLREKIKLVDELLQLMNEADENTKVDAHYLLLHSVEEGLADYLVERLKKGNRVNTQIALIQALAIIGNVNHAKQLLFELQHGEVDSRKEVITTLGKIGGDALVTTIFDQLVPPPPLEAPYELRVRAALALGEIGTKKAAYSLKAAASRVSQDDINNKALYKIIEWALAKAEGEFDTPITDDKIPNGQYHKLRFKGMQYHYYRPPFDNRKWEKPWLLICIHDKSYDPSASFEFCKSLAKKERLAVLAPVFDPIRFRDYETLNYRGWRSDTILLELVDFLADKTSVAGRQLFMWGVGEGGSFVQRFAYLHPDRVARAAFTTSEYTMLQEDKYFPVGLKPSPFSPAMAFDPSKIANIDLAYFWSREQGIKEGRIASSTPPFVEQFRNYARDLEVLPRLVFFRRQYRDEVIHQWMFDTLNRLDIATP